MARDVTLVAIPISRRRGTAGALVGFGTSGLILVVCGAALVLGSMGALGDTALSLQAQRRTIVEMLGPAADAIDHAATSAKGAGTSLSSSAESARSAAELTAQLGTAMARMSDASRVSILGAQPFTGLATELQAVADRSTTLSTDLRHTADGIERNVTDAATSSADLGRLATELRRLQDSLQPASSSSDPVAGARQAVDVTRIVLLGLLAWLAIPAIAALWLGWRWLRPTRVE